MVASVCKQRLNLDLGVLSRPIWGQQGGLCVTNKTETLVPNPKGFYCRPNVRRLCNVWRTLDNSRLGSMRKNTIMLAIISVLLYYQYVVYYVLLLIITAKHNHVSFENMKFFHSSVNNVCPWLTDTWFSQAGLLQVNLTFVSPIAQMFGCIKSRLTDNSFATFSVFSLVHVALRHRGIVGLDLCYSHMNKNAL